MSKCIVPMRRLGRSGLTVSRVCLGTMMFGGRTDETEARRMVDEAFEAGVNFIDTADVYAGGVSEEIVGRAIASERPEWVVATKVGHPMGGAREKGLSRRWIMEEVPLSLKRLGTDYVDILYLHTDDRDTPLEETVRAIADLRQAGSVRYFGVSNFQAWRIAEICALCDNVGIDRPVVCQPVYHALNRSVEVEVLPACGHFGLGTAIYSPLARGLLTGKYRDGAPPPEGSRASTADPRMMETEYHPDALVAASLIAEHAASRRIDPAAFAIAWTLANPLVTSVVAGPRTLEQWRGYIAAMDIEIDPDDEAAIDAIVRGGSTANPHYIDPRYPVRGRPVMRT